MSLFIFALSVVACSAQTTATIHVRAHAVEGPVNPLIFGHNVEASDSLDIFTDFSNPIPGLSGTGIWNPSTASPVPETVGFAQDIGMGMLRYPGGSLVANYNWKAAVGPTYLRTNYLFGIHEYLTYCETVGAEPLMMVSEYFGTPQDAADLVEYLNAPATSTYPWAQMRATNGHPEPFGVKYFEMGNEPDLGNHNLQPSWKMSAQEYGDWFNTCASLMKAIDPTIQMGAAMGTFGGPQNVWNYIVLERVKDAADFIVVHAYAVGLGSETNYPTDNLMRACMAYGEQLESTLEEYRAIILERTGESIPLAVTEFNGAFVQETPIPYRFSLGAALFSADLIRIMMKPENNVLMANYWQFVNGYWGMQQGPIIHSDTSPWVAMAAFPLFRLWGQHIGQQIVEIDVTGPDVEFEGSLNTRPARNTSVGGPAAFTLQAGSAAGHAWTTVSSNGLDLVLNNFTGEVYPKCGHIPNAYTSGTYRLSFDARTSGTITNGPTIGMGMIDDQGWVGRYSANAIEGVHSQTNWQRFSGDLTTLPDVIGLDINWRIIGFVTALSATVEVRNIRVDLLPDPPAYQALTAMATVNAPSNALYLTIFNKHHTNTITAAIHVPMVPLVTGRYWQVTGPNLEATNVGTTNVVESTSGAPLTLVTNGLLSHAFPPHSMTAIELVFEHPTYGDWETLNNIEGSGPDGDADSDGRQNAVEFAFDWDPNGPDDVQWGTLSTSNETALLSIEVPSFIGLRLPIRVEISSNLIDWATVDPSAVWPAGTNPISGGEIESQVVTLPYEPAAGPIYLRLRVTP